MNTNTAMHQILDWIVQNKSKSTQPLPLTQLIKESGIDLGEETNVKNVRALIAYHFKKSENLARFTGTQRAHLIFLLSAIVTKDVEEDLKQYGDVTIRDRRLTYFRTFDGKFQRKGRHQNWTGKNSKKVYEKITKEDALIVKFELKTEIEAAEMGYKYKLIERAARNAQLNAPVAKKEPADTVEMGSRRVKEETSVPVEEGSNDIKPPPPIFTAGMLIDIIQNVAGRRIPPKLQSYIATIQNHNLEIEPKHFKNRILKLIGKLEDGQVLNGRIPKGDTTITCFLTRIEMALEKFAGLKEIAEFVNNEISEVAEDKIIPSAEIPERFIYLLELAKPK